MTISLPITSTRDLIDYLFFAQGEHLRDMLSPVSFSDAPFYTSDDTLDYLDAATDLFSLMIDFYHHDRDPNELIAILMTYSLFSFRYACDGVSPAFDIFPCTDWDYSHDDDTDALTAFATQMGL